MKYLISYDKSTSVTVDDVYACAEYCGNKGVKVFYYYTNGTCVAISRVASYTIETSAVIDSKTRNFTVYVASARKGCTCSDMDSENAQISIISLTYGENICPQGFNYALDKAMSYLCVNTVADLDDGSDPYGHKFDNFRVGVTTNVTGYPEQSQVNNYVMNRAQATETVKYTCSNDQAFVVFLLDGYYCHLQVDLYINTTVPLVQNHCKHYLTGGTPVKLFNEMIRGFLYINHAGWPVVGIVPNGTGWMYWDNTTVGNDIVWQSGYPGDGDIAMIGVQGLSMFNGPENVQNQFPCMASATKS
ncbi:unnamed protein product [Bursaphelenchus xylophilus]|uniref:(pine wood nematode) hypothetical protein n=1 Tax=Bursaphelenchus xylophilus TaxID=6326 RepID=A0A1I7RN63_BURXY|nr:unnamed protein product [Bursaphelenchus xylophilus]CAG9087741.1 unnamed protein product [Bursaphelenchus xylophilus]